MKRVRQTESAIEDATRVLQAAYWDDVYGIVEDVEDAIKAGEMADMDAVMEYVEQSCDGHERVIYTGQAIETLRYSDHDEAYVDEMGKKAPMPEWSVLAYFALVADVMEALPGEDELFPAPEDESDHEDE